MIKGVALPYGQSAYIRGRRGRLSREWALARASCSEAARRAVPSVQRRVGGCCRGADAGRCSRQGKLNNSPALRGRCTSRCAPPLPPLQGSCPPEGGRSRPRVFAHVASVAPLLRSSRAWPHIDRASSGDASSGSSSDSSTDWILVSPDCSPQKAASDRTPVRIPAQVRFPAMSAQTYFVAVPKRIF